MPLSEDSWLPHGVQSGQRCLRKRRIFGRVFGFHSSDEEDESTLEETNQLRNRRAPSGVHCSDDDGDTDCSSSNEDYSEGGAYFPGPLLESELLDGLSNWLDRLYEGSLRRFHVEQWPFNLRGDISF
ncbi:unnamed protein product [Protopolystoma xenopodis]|uniref:Uncharacterized protein n=1 Tax=Protopolystoma xenopodis TaxID=117903 RepID=A0A3S5ARW6_9PLAT|nr:unnamed protein product [Protopolystoma xenopodis]